MLAAALALHVFAAVVWVGGMFFAYMALRPTAAQLLEPAQRLPLWRGVFTRFFPWVWLAVLSLLITGYGMLFMLFNGFTHAPVYVHIMHGLGILMMLLYMHVFFAPYRRLRLALDDNNLPEAGRRLNQIRQIIAINLSLGIIVVIVASAGRFLV